MFKYFIYKFGQFWVNILPLKCSYCIATFLSDLQYYFSFRDRRAVRNNLRLIVPPGSNIPRLTREVFKNFGKYLVDFFSISLKLDERFVQDNVKIKNIEVIDQALQNGKGAIIITAHMGNWELGAMVLAFLGYPLVAVALPHKERPVNDLFNQLRERRGITIIPTSIAIRRCLETLKDNKLIAVVADRDFTSNGEIMDFLNRKAIIPRGAAIFSIKTGAPIIPCFMIREPDDSFTFSFHTPIYPSRVIQGEIDKETLVGMMKSYISIIEQKIREHPTQWLMFREYWVP